MLTTAKISKEEQLRLFVLKLQTQMVKRGTTNFQLLKAVFQNIWFKYNDMQIIPL